jgi:hypothetical protein
VQVLGIVGSVSPDSKTRTAVERALAGAEAAGATGPGADAADGSHGAPGDGDVDTEVLHLAEYDVDDADGTHLDELTGDTAAALDRSSAPPVRSGKDVSVRWVYTRVMTDVWNVDAVGPPTPVDAIGSPVQVDAVGPMATVDAIGSPTPVDPPGRRTARPVVLTSDRSRRSGAADSRRGRFEESNETSLVRTTGPARAVSRAGCDREVAP